MVIDVAHADAFITFHHRHHAPPSGALFAVGVTVDDRLVGVAIIGRPVPPAPDDGSTAEVTRTATNDILQVEVALYRAAWQVARTWGYRRLITHTQALSIQRGLREVGLRPVAMLPPRAGSHTPRRARTDRGVDGVCRIRWATNGHTSRSDPSHPNAPASHGGSAAHREPGLPIPHSREVPAGAITRASLRLHTTHTATTRLSIKDTSPRRTATHGRRPARRRPAAATPIAHREA